MYTSVFTLAGAAVWVTLTRSASMVEGYVTGLKYSSFGKERFVVGLDVEWTSTDPNSRVAILQLCLKDRCLIVEMAHLDHIPQLLKVFLADPNVTFVGVGIADDISKLHRVHGLECQNAVEIGGLAAKAMGCSGLADAGLVQLAREVLGLDVEKDLDVARNTDWSATTLCHQQILYAATVAYVSYRIGDRLLGEK